MADRPEVGRRLADDVSLPTWLRPLVARVDGAPLPNWVLHAAETPAADARLGAVLMLFAGAPDQAAGDPDQAAGDPDQAAGDPDQAAGTPGGSANSLSPDLLLTGRATTLRSHAGQPAFPGGAVEAGESPVAAALREAHEETGLDPESVIPAAALPPLYLRPSGFLVRPILGYWREPGPVYPVDRAETETVVRVPVRDLVDPAHRGTVVIDTVPTADAGDADPAPRRLITPAFDVAGLVVWGFTAGLVDMLLQWGGWAVPWDRSRRLVPAGFAARRDRPRAPGPSPAGMPRGAAAQREASAR